jgi:hypothetical protein
VGEESHGTGEKQAEEERERERERERKNKSDELFRRIKNNVPTWNPYKKQIY